jgi:flagellar motor switch protein FliM
MVQLPNAEADTIDIVYPLQTLKPIAAQLRSRVQSDSSNDNISWREKMENAILNIPLGMTALLGQPMMSVGGLMRLEAGDVLPMNVGEGVTVKVEENPIFIGEIGEIAGKSAISLQKRI